MKTKQNEQIGKTCAFGGNWSNKTISDNKLYYMVKLLYTDFGVREFRSTGTTSFEKAVENAIIRLKKTKPDIALVYIQKYRENVESYSYYIESRYDSVLVADVVTPVRDRSNSFARACKWVAQNSDYTFVYSENNYGYGNTMMKMSKDKFLFNLKSLPKSWKNLVGEIKENAAS